MHARRVTVIAHPVRSTVAANRSRERIVAQTTGKTIRCTRAIGCFAARTHPARLAGASCRGAVTDAVPGARHSAEHPINIRKPAHPRGRLAVDTWAVTGATRNIAERAPKPKPVVADTALVLYRVIRPV